MKLSVLLFGITKEIVGNNRLNLEVEEGISVELLKKHLSALYPDLNQLNSLAIAVNSNYVLEDLELQAGDEIAVIPPVSGG
jgi:molybdopterin synthase sulfur carrier subunit